MTTVPALIQQLENRGLQAEAQLIRQDDLLLRMSMTMVETMGKLADLTIDSSAKLQVSGVVLVGMSKLSALINEMQAEGIRTKGLIHFATNH